MLQKIHIQNYAIIDNIELEFDSGLNIITGETGAGKSILLGALGLVMGKRADSKVWFDKSKKCIVEAEYEFISKEIDAFCHAYDFDVIHPLVIRREITPAGKSRSFINDTPATLKQLQEINEHLIELHQQFDTLEIFKQSFQTKFLDLTSGSWELFRTYKLKYDELQLIQSKHRSLQEKIAENLKEKSYLEFQISELDDLGLEEGEEMHLEDQQKQLTYASEIKSAIYQNIHSLYEHDSSILSTLKDNLRLLEQVSGFSNLIENVSTRLNSCIIELDDIVQELNQIEPNIVDDPGQLTEVEERLQAIFALRQKHQVSSADELVHLKSSFEESLLQLEDHQLQEQNMAIEVEKKYKELLSIGSKLSHQRNNKREQVEKSLMKNLHQLGMPQAQLSFELIQRETPGPFGMENIELLFSANKGISLQSIKGVASGGELSRLNLCIKTMIADSVQLQTLIFDEIDTGISGEVAKVMGRMLKDLGISHQVISITHSPMIAALGQSHYFVSKDHTGDKTITQLTKLNSEERVIEIAKMLGGDPPSKMSIASAKELLQN